MESVNPFNNTIIAEYDEMSESAVEKTIEKSLLAWYSWEKRSFSSRADLMKKAAAILRRNKNELARLITLEMGKLIGESISEVEKCAMVCDYYADHTESMLKDEFVETDGQRSFITFQPIGPVLAVMPWNYPFWQVFRFAAPAIMAGNTGLLKHASNVQGCALAIEKVFLEAGFPENVFSSLIIGSSKVESVIKNPAIKAVTLTGSEMAGRYVAEAAGKYLKKSVLELGGSDPFIVLSDANLMEAAKTGIKSRMLTSGQTCISAKRFIVKEDIADQFISLIKNEMEALKAGDPMDPNTTLAPLAQIRFAHDLHNQISDSVKMGAKVIIGAKYEDNTSYFYPPTILTNITEKMPVFKEETFGPVAAVITAKNDEEIAEIANNSLFGLGCSIWTEDLQKGEALGREIEAGAIFINGLVKSDPRLPFGGMKNSGYGRELSNYGIKEFCNIKTIWIK